MKLLEQLKKKVSSIPRRYLAAVIVLISAVLLIVIVLAPVGSGSADISKIERNSYGESARKESLRVLIEGEKAQEVELEIRPREYTSEELQALFGQAMRILDKTIAGENKSLDCVTQDLDLPGKLPGLPFSIVWEFSRYDVIDMNGRLKPEVLKELDAGRDGILLGLTAVLRYKEEEALYSVQARIFAADDNADIAEKLIELVKKTDEETQESRYLRLPDELEGRHIRWKSSEGSGAPAILLLGMIGGICILLMDKQKKEKERRERQLQMLCDYPEIISQFTMLMGAGLTAKNTWKRVTEDYQEKKKQTGRDRAAYEEMLYTWQEMQSGIPESESYERFARRCGLTVYMKFGALLSQNLKKGAKGMSDILRIEAVQALEDRKSRAKRLGEEAGTKLLAPMFLMLAVVMAVIIIPAFWSIQV